uniref:Uncharacterized protein n=1 Tax=Manihot esculenta TaxID=3983 RepID=A0A2C9U4X7_MANES
MARFRISLCLIFLSFSWSATHHLNPDKEENKSIIGSIQALVENAKGNINFGLLNFSSARDLGDQDSARRKCSIPPGDPHPHHH